MFWPWRKIEWVSSSLSYIGRRAESVGSLSPKRKDLERCGKNLSQKWNWSWNAFPWDIFQVGKMGCHFHPASNNSFAEIVWSNQHICNLNNLESHIGVLCVSLNSVSAEISCICPLYLKEAPAFSLSSLEESGMFGIILLIEILLIEKVPFVEEFHSIFQRLSFQGALFCSIPGFCWQKWSFGGIVFSVVWL